MMKYFLVLVFATAAWALSDELKKTVAELAPACIAEAGIDGTLLEKVDDIESAGKDPKFQCFIKCIVEKRGLFHDGALDLEKTMAHLTKTHPAEEVEHLMEHCKEIKGANDCEIAFNHVSCYESFQKN